MRNSNTKSQYERIVVVLQPDTLAAKPALINKGDGALLRCCFQIADVAGGFTAGYYWRILFSERAVQTEKV